MPRRWADDMGGEEKGKHPQEIPAGAESAGSQSVPPIFITEKDRDLYTRDPDPFLFIARRMTVKEL